jgi:hypothetical protein
MHGPQAGGSYLDKSVIALLEFLAASQAQFKCSQTHPSLLQLLLPASTSKVRNETG